MIKLVLLWHFGILQATLVVTGFPTMQSCRDLLVMHATRVAFTHAVVDSAKCVMEAPS